jgi:hypothetical protein
MPQIDAETLITGSTCRPDNASHILNPKPAARGLFHAQNMNNADIKPTVLIHGGGRLGLNSLQLMAALASVGVNVVAGIERYAEVTLTEDYLSFPEAE